VTELEIEAVARAICELKGWPPDTFISSKRPIPMWTLETDVARAAIAALPPPEDRP